MSLRGKLLSTLETLSDLAWAAEFRFKEGEILLHKGYNNGAIYLFGLSAEIWLKLACFHYLKALPTTPVSAQLTPAKLWMKHYAPHLSPEGYHNLLFWSEFLILRRIVDGRPFGRDDVGRLRHHVNHRLYQDWKIDLRYRLIAITDLQALRVYNDALWVRGAWKALSR